MQTPARKTKQPPTWVIILWLIALVGWASYKCITSTLVSAIERFDPCGHKIAVATTDPKATKILFIGNSFTYANNVPGIFVWMLNKQQPQHHFQVESFTLPGYRIREHQQRSEVKDLLSKQPWDFVILQEASNAAFAGQSSVYRSFEAFLPLIKANGAKPLAIMTWADRGCFTNQSIISQTYRRTGHELTMPVLPVGDLFFYIQEKHPEIDLYIADGHHPSVAGAYLYALTIYAQLFGNKNLPIVENKDKSPNTPLLKPKVSQELAMSIREWQSVLKIRPEFREESPDSNTDIAYYWTMNGRPAEAEVICQTRMDAVNRLFPLENNSATADALRHLADAEYMFKTPEKMKQAYDNYVRAEQIYRKTEGPNSKDAAEIANFAQQIKPYLKL